MRKYNPVRSARNTVLPYNSPPFIENYSVTHLLSCKVLFTMFPWQFRGDWADTAAALLPRQGIFGNGNFQLPRGPMQQSLATEWTCHAVQELASESQKRRGDNIAAALDPFGDDLFGTGPTRMSGFFHLPASTVHIAAESGGELQFPPKTCELRN